MIKLDVTLDIASAKWKNSFPRMKQKMEQAAALAFLNAKKPAALKGRRFQVGLILTDDANIKKLNNAFRGMNKPTNVLSFPQLSLKGLRSKDLDVFPARHAIPLGDSVLAFQTIKKEAKDQGKTIEAHVIHLVVHGTLHLLGYDHMKAKEAKVMEQLECDILASLGYPDPYHGH